MQMKITGFKNTGTLSTWLVGIGHILISFSHAVLYETSKPLKIIISVLAYFKKEGISVVRHGSGGGPFEMSGSAPGGRLFY